MGSEPSEIGAGQEAQSSPQGIAAGFSSRFPDFRCLVCGSPDFFLIDRDGQHFTTRLEVHDETHRGGAMHFNTVTLACSTCGHIYPFLTDILREAVEQGAERGPSAFP